MTNSKVLAIGFIVTTVLFPTGACRKASRSTAVAPKPTSREVSYWYDPMKPEVHFDHPGKSPFMEMELVPMYRKEPPAAPASAAKKILYWYDPMNAQLRSDRPGKAPDGMNLVPKYADATPAAGSDSASPPGLSVVRVPLERRQEIGVTTAKVVRRPIGGSIEANGVIAEDESRLNAVNAKFSGYIERLVVDRTGQPVRRGQPLLTIYSPELVATERELLLAAENARRLQQSSSSGASSDALSLLAATRQRLRFWDIPQSEIDRVEKKGEVSKTMTLYSPVSGVVLKKDAVAGMAITSGMLLFTIADLSSVWVLADVYQGEIAAVVSGRSAEVSSSFLPGETFRGRVDFIYPTVSEDTRTVKIRVVVPNPTGSLKPGIFVRVSLQGRQREAVAVPRSALIATGERQIVFVEQSPGVYTPREVKTGASEGDYVEVLSGTSAGETVVTSANFLIDSESRIGGIGIPPAGSAGQPAQPAARKPGDSQ